MIVIVDSHHLAYQALYTLDLSYNDLPTGILYGFLSRVLSMGQKFNTNNFVFCFEGRNSLRKQQFSDYKNNRKVIDEEKKQRLFATHEQISKIRDEILPQIGFSNVIFHDGYEADDIIMRLCLDMKEEIVISSADMDLYQCLLPHVCIYDSAKKIIMDSKMFEDKYGISYTQWHDVKALAGCETDAVPGIPSVGIKTAIKYLKNELSVKAKAYQSIKSNRDIYLRNLSLVKLPYKDTPSITLQENKFNKKGFYDVCNKYGFDSFLNNIDEWRSFFKKVNINKLIHDRWMR